MLPSRPKSRNDTRSIPAFLLVTCLDQPAPGLAHLFVLPMGDQTFVPIRVYLYGEQAAAIAAATEPVWRAWLEGVFPST